MPPQNTDTPPAGSNQFDFILKEPPKAPRKLPLPNLPKPVLLILGGAIIFFIVIIAASLIFGSKTTGTEQLVDIMAQSKEIARVSDLVHGQTQSGDTKALAVTTSESLNSQQQQIGKYLKSHSFKIDPKKLLAHLTKSTDKDLQAASQNNNYDQVYLAYLKTNLQSYSSSLNKTYKSVSKDARSILTDSYSSIQILLSAPQLK